MTDTVATELGLPNRPRLFDRLARRILLGQLTHLCGGEIIVEDEAGQHHLGELADLQTTVRVRQSRFYREAVLGGTLAVGQSYVHGDWDCDDLVALFRIFIRNMADADRLDGGFARLAGWAQKLVHRWRANDRHGSRRNIHAHYDLGNDFFGLWLDDTMAYSSGIFRKPEATLREASIEKFDRVCRKLDLRRSDNVLEIGGGWGGFALHAAQHYGCRVTTTTISRQQFEWAEARVAAAGLDNLVTVQLRDYRDLQGRYDKLVSIEMIEAVGHRYLDSYLRKCGELLRPDGTQLLQAIVMPERRHKRYLSSVDFIQRYIFPGGCLPSLASILEATGRASDLRFVHAEDFAPHYAETVRRWRAAFNERVNEVRGLGHSREFVRLWNYYLCYCEALFAERYVGVLQIQLDKPLCRRDPIAITDQAAGTAPLPHQPRPSTSLASHAVSCHQRAMP